ncbi:MAG TPA: sigma-70 family RNA polymerase sigma factor [Bryobacteraceae bacterium]|nr:sigma-70 family RNA polymerase sigma factor [Bryobacteraceae bacterium]
MHPVPEPSAQLPDREAVTRLLKQISRGDRQAFDHLVPLVYDQLRRLAAQSLRAERPDHTLRATALVHEAYLKLADSGLDWQDRVHFYAVAARVMRHILVDYARGSERQKRGSGAKHVGLDEAVLVDPSSADGLPDLDESLNRLEMHDARKAKVIELLFFGGMTYAETAGALGISEATVHRELKMAKAWLYRDLAGPAA